MTVNGHMQKKPVLHVSNKDTIWTHVGSHVSIRESRWTYTGLYVFINTSHGHMQPCMCPQKFYVDICTAACVQKVYAMDTYSPTCADKRGCWTHTEPVCVRKRDVMNACTPACVHQPCLLDTCRTCMCPPQNFTGHMQILHVSMAWTHAAMDTCRNCGCMCPLR